MTAYRTRLVLHFTADQGDLVELAAELRAHLVSAPRTYDVRADQRSGYRRLKITGTARAFAARGACRHALHDVDVALDRTRSTRQTGRLPDVPEPEQVNVSARTIATPAAQGQG